MGLAVVAENLIELVARVLVAALVAMIIAILAGPSFIAFLRRKEIGQTSARTASDTTSPSKGPRRWAAC